MLEGEPVAVTWILSQAVNKGEHGLRGEKVDVLPTEEDTSLNPSCSCRPGWRQGGGYAGGEARTNSSDHVIQTCLAISIQHSGSGNIVSRQARSLTNTGKIISPVQRPGLPGCILHGVHGDSRVASNGERCRTIVHDTAIVVVGVVES